MQIQIQKKMKKSLFTAKPLKAQMGIGDLQTVAIVFIVLAVVLAVGSYILTSIGTQGAFGANTVANQTLGYGQTALKTFSSWLPILAVVIVSAIVIYILVGVFHGGGHNRAA